MKITDYPTSQFFDENDVLIKDGTNGTKQIKASDMVYALFDPIPEMHKEIFRGKSLGSTFTTAQQQAITDGSFHDLWIGDYWESGDIKYRIADFNYFISRVDGATTEDSSGLARPHLIVVPDAPIAKTTLPFHSVKTGLSYPNASIRTSSQMITTKNAITSFFGDSHVMKHYDYYCAAITTAGNGEQVADYRHNVEFSVELMEANMVVGDQTVILGKSTGLLAGQLALFRLDPKYIMSMGSYDVGSKDKYSYWTRTPAYFDAEAGTNVNIVTVGDAGTSTTSPISSSTAYIRPYFVLI